VETGSREENASKQESRASVLIQSEPKKALAGHDAIAWRAGIEIMRGRDDSGARRVIAWIVGAI